MTIVPRCHQCSKPLPANRGRYCSIACYRLPTYACCRCGRSYAPWRRSQRYCSVPCVKHRPPPPSHPSVRLLVLAILRTNTHAWLTLSDLGIWTYGDDGPAEIHAIRQCLSRLRRHGHVLETRSAVWEGSYGRKLAYRLATFEARRVA